MGEEEKRSEKKRDAPPFVRPELPVPSRSLRNSPLFRFFTRWFRHVLQEERQASSGEAVASPPVSFSFSLLLLRTLPWISLFLFLLSGYLESFLPSALSLPWRSEPVSLEGVVRMVAVSGLIGFGTNWIAIHMLFHPRRRRPLLGQGLIPARKEQIIHQLSLSISREIINSDLIGEQIRRSGFVTRHREMFQDNLRELLRQPEFRKDLRELFRHYLFVLLDSPTLRESLVEFLTELDLKGGRGVTGRILRLYRGLISREEREKKVRRILENLTLPVDRWEELFLSFAESLPVRMEREAPLLEEVVLQAILFFLERVDIQEVILENLGGFDESRLEELLKESTDDQLNYIQYLGSFLGMLGGLFIWLPLESLLFFGILGGLLLLLDSLLLRTTRRQS